MVFNDEHRVKCSICKRTYRPIEAHINLVCNDCYRERPPDATGLLKEFLEDKKEELNKVQEIWEFQDDFDTEEKFDIIIGYLDNQYQKWEAKLKTDVVRG